MSVNHHHVSKPVCSVMFWPDLVFILPFLWQSTVEITYLISYHWNTATLFVPTYGRWIFYLFCFWIIVFCPVCWSSLSVVHWNAVGWHLLATTASPVWPGQYQYGPDWHHARQTLAHPWPVNPSQKVCGAATVTATMCRYIRSSFFSLRKYLRVLVSTAKF